jgi:hypothetical protein
MADVIAAASSTGDESPSRKQFEAPVVQDLGRLQELTQLLQGTIILEP